MLPFTVAVPFQSWVIRWPSGKDYATNIYLGIGQVSEPFWEHF
jgi:hypothetical protein